MAAPKQQVDGDQKFNADSSSDMTQTKLRLINPKGAYKHRYVAPTQSQSRRHFETTLIVALSPVGTSKLIEYSGLLNSWIDYLVVGCIIIYYLWANINLFYPDERKDKSIYRFGLWCNVQNCIIITSTLFIGLIFLFKPIFVDWEIGELMFLQMGAETAWQIIRLLFWLVIAGIFHTSLRWCFEPM